jgi:hypothetical protein
VEHRRRFRVCSPVRLADLYARRAHLNRAIHALEEVQRIRRRRRLKFDRILSYARQRNGR